MKNKIYIRVAVFSLAYALTIFIADRALGACSAGQTQYNTALSPPVMQVCNGSGVWTNIGGMNDGTGCRWLQWASKGDAGSGNANLYSGPNGTPLVPPGASPNSSGAYCNLNEYAAGVSGDGVTQGSKHDWGWVLCCPIGGASASGAASGAGAGAGGGAGGAGGGAGGGRGGGQQVSF